MATTIQVSRELHGHLKALKEKMRVRTFEEVLRRLLERPGRAAGSRFGAHPKMKAFEHRDESHEP